MPEATELIRTRPQTNSTSPQLLYILIILKAGYLHVPNSTAAVEVYTAANLVIGAEGDAAGVGRGEL